MVEIAENPSTAARLALRNAEVKLAAAQERARAIVERANQIRCQLEDTIERLDASEAVREQILQAMLFDDTAQDGLDRYHEERSQMERESADLEELHRKACEAAEKAKQGVSHAQNAVSRCDEQVMKAVLEERCNGIRSLVTLDLEDAALAAKETTHAWGSDRAILARERLVDLLMPLSLFMPNEQQREVVLARIRTGQ